MELADYWGKVFETSSPKFVASGDADTTKPELDYIWATISVEDVSAAEGANESVPGPNGIRARQWNKLRADKKAILFNLFLLTGDITQSLLDPSRVLRTIGP